ncbi:MAG TPA: FkbM family methyltransferase [Longimicrobiaceae bacterium]|nr:FkbM family methyltransferase [Longimicrobiaceae bacterium]
MSVLPAAPLWVRAAAALLRRLPAGRYRLMDRLPRRAPPFAARLAPELGGMRFRCDLRDSVAREACFTGRYEPQETALLRALLGPGAVFVDVGANWGYFSLLAAHRVGPGGRVLALEPDPRLFAVLRDNLAANGLRHAVALPLAAAEAPGTLALAGYEEAGGNWGVSSVVTAAAEAAPRFAVQGARVDDVLDAQGVGRVDLLKLDVEGAELLALRGMRAGLAAGRYRRVLLELHPRAPGGAEMVAAALEALRGAGYAGWSIDHSPAAARRAAYARSPDARGFLRPTAEADPGDPWPHQLWTAPGDEPR